MTIKNTSFFLAMLATAMTNISAMETPFDDMKKKHAAFAQTEEFICYEKAKQLHEEYNIPETAAFMEEAADRLLKLTETQEFLETVEKKQPEPNPVVTFSDAVHMTLRAMENTQEYKQYEDAEIAHKLYNTADTLYILDLCKSDLHKTKQYQEWLTTTKKEINVVHNIIQSSPKFSALKSTYASCALSPEQKVTEIKAAQQLKKKADAAWLNLSQSDEYSLYKQAKRNHEIYNTPDTLSLLKMHESRVTETKQAQCFYKAQEQAHQFLEKKNGLNNKPVIGKIIIELPLDTKKPTQPMVHDTQCFNHASSEKIMMKLKLTHIPIIEKNNITTTQQSSCVKHIELSKHFSK